MCVDATKSAAPAQGILAYDHLTGTLRAEAALGGLAVGAGVGLPIDATMREGRPASGRRALEE